LGFVSIPGDPEMSKDSDFQGNKFFFAEIRCVKPHEFFLKDNSRAIARYMHRLNNPRFAVNGCPKGVANIPKSWRRSEGDGRR
jgi:hypothetical protein